MPASFSYAPGVSFAEYETCVKEALDRLVATDVIARKARGRFWSSVVRAFASER